MSWQVGSELRLEIESLAAGGSGVARTEGRVVFVPYSAPGDEIRARLTQVKPRFAHAELLQVIKPGPGRRESPCRHFGVCGGCSWLHLDEKTQQEARIAILSDALRRIARIKELPPVETLASPTPLAYRSRARVAHEAGRVGFRAPHSHRVIDIGRCIVLDEATQQALAAVRRKPPQGKGEIEVRGYEEAVEVVDRTLRVTRGAFFQAHRRLWDDWCRTVVDACGSGRLALDLYAGVGFYTFLLENSFERVVAVERGGAALDAKHNTAAEVHRKSVEAWLPSMVGQIQPDVVLMNPPRSGCDECVIDALREIEPARIVYVSCEPSTLARDLARLGPRFRMARLVSIDALPQTHHVEAIAVLERIDSKTS